MKNRVHSKKVKKQTYTPYKKHPKHIRHKIHNLVLSALKKKKGKKSKLNNNKYLKTGVPGFDNMLRDGIPEGSSVLICGSPGSGKTIFSLEVCYAKALQGERCLYMSFEEPEYRLRQHMRDFGWDPAPLEKKGLLMIRRFNPFDITRSIEALLTKAKRELLIKIDPVFFPTDFKPTIIILDSLSAIGSAFVGREDSYRIYIEQLFRFFEELGATSFLVTETERPESMRLTRSGIEGFLADGIIIMHYVSMDGRRYHSIEVLKMRGGNFENKKVQLRIIKGKGVIVYPNRIV